MKQRPDATGVHAHMLLPQTGEPPARLAIDVLGRILQSDEDPAVRMETVGALAGIPGQEAVEAIAVGLGDPESAIRHQVLEQLWQRGSGSLHLIGQALLADPDPAVRTRAVEMLAADASPAALALLESAAGDPDEAVRGSALRKLGRDP